MTSVLTTTRHAFLTPGHNCWFIWTCDGSQSITNPGATHRTLESLSYAVDQMARDGWEVKSVFLDHQGSPNLVFLTREESLS